MSKTIAIWIEGGCCRDVFNLPEGWNYEVVDTDADDKTEEEYDAVQERLAELEETYLN